MVMVYTSLTSVVLTEEELCLHRAFPGNLKYDENSSLMAASDDGNPEEDEMRPEE